MDDGTSHGAALHPHPALGAGRSLEGEASFPGERRALFSSEAARLPPEGVERGERLLFAVARSVRVSLSVREAVRSAGNRLSSRLREVGAFSKTWVLT